jgi:hypothetical protein
MRVTHPATVVGSVAALVTLAWACGGGSAADESAPRTPREALLQNACRGGDERTLELAVAEYVKQAKPKPQRFLTAPGTDSALPDPGVRVLQDKGPLYYFPADPAQQASVRKQLHDKGDYTTLLVVPRGSSMNERSATVRLGGHFVGGEEDGRPAGDRSYAFTCDSAGWRITKAAADQSA